MDGKLLKPQTKTDSVMSLAGVEGLELKKLIGALRSLWCSSRTAGFDDRITELKGYLRPSPGDPDEDENGGQLDDENDGQPDDLLMVSPMEESDGEGDGLLEEPHSDGECDDPVEESQTDDERDDPIEESQSHDEGGDPIEAPSSDEGGDPIEDAHSAAADGDALCLVESNDFAPGDRAASPEPEAVLQLAVRTAFLHQP